MSMRMSLIQPVCRKDDLISDSSLIKTSSSEAEISFKTNTNCAYL